MASFFKDVDQLFEAISQALLNAADRDAFTGWGAIVKIMYSRFRFLALLNVLL